MERIEETKIKINKRANLLGVRAKTPLVFRWLAIVAIAATVLGIGVGFYQARGNKDFRMIPGLAELSKDVTAVVNGYERRETDGNILKYYVKADRATTFSDNHQELENAYFEVYDERGEKFDTLSAAKAIYIPAEDKNFTAYFFGNVNINTRDNLKVKSEQLTYTRADETVTTEELIEFSRENISGKSIGALVKIREKQIELKKDVDINSAPPSEAGQTPTSIQTAKLVAGRAVFDQGTEQIELEHNVFINIVPANSAANSFQPTDIRAEKAIAFFENREIKKIDLNQNAEVFSKPTNANPKFVKARGNLVTATFATELNRIELNENVDIETTNSKLKPTRIRSQNAVYDKPADKFDLKTGVEIVTVEDEKPTVIRSNEAIYEQSGGKVFLTGAADITSGNNYIKGDSINATLFPNKKLQNAHARGNSYLKQTLPDRTTEVTAAELNSAFGENQQIQNANAVGAANVSITPAHAQNYSKATIFAPQAIRLAFRAAGSESVLSQIHTDGRTAIVMNPVPGKPNSSFRKITADSVRTVLSENGRDLLRAEAVGNGEIYVEPVQHTPENYKSTITAPRFDCDFYEGNNAKNCTSTGKSKAVMVPFVPAQNRGARTLTADKLITDFNQNTHDIDRFDALENAKFTELDRSATASRITFTGSDETVRLRGGEPTIWDSQARAKAVEIDWNTKTQKSFLNGKVSTTYYSQRQTGGATPFSNSKAPVYVTSNEAQFDYQTQVGVYLGNARSWQENNYVRAEKLVLQEKARRMDGEGKVQSLLYNTRRKTGEQESSQPTFAASDTISYTDENKLLHYEGNVDIRQDKDRITAGIADVYLNEKNEARQTVLQNNVVFAQPNRRATGTWAQYTTSDEIVILRGNPASVVDAESGSSQGSQMTISLRDNRVVNQGATKPNTSGRTRSVYKVNP
jgi:LPS export ABC transporter protein LptC